MIPVFYAYKKDEIEIMTTDYFNLQSKVAANPLDYKARHRLVDLLFSRVCKPAYQQLYGCCGQSTSLTVIKEGKTQALSEIQDLIKIYVNRHADFKLSQNRRAEGYGNALDILRHHKEKGKATQTN